VVGGGDLLAVDPILHFGLRRRHLDAVMLDASLRLLEMVAHFLFHLIGAAADLGFEVKKPAIDICQFETQALAELINVLGHDDVLLFAMNLDRRHTPLAAILEGPLETISGHFRP
jgi:hypothetical protein